MKFEIDKKSFLRVLLPAAAIAERKGPLSVLTHVQLVTTTTDARVRASATDNYMGIEAYVAASITAAGSLSVHAKTLCDIVKGLPDDKPIKIAEVGNAIELKCGKAKFKLPRLPGSEFPALPRPKKATLLTLTAEEFESLIAQSRYAASPDETRPHMAGIFLQSDNENVSMVATDGKRLSAASMPVKQQAPSSCSCLPALSTSLATCSRLALRRLRSQRTTAACSSVLRE